MTLELLSFLCVIDYPQAAATFSVLRGIDPYRSTNMDTYSDVLFVMVQIKINGHCVCISGSVWCQ